MAAIINSEAEQELLDLHRGLQIAMDGLIRDKDYDHAEAVLRQVDQRMTEFLNRVQIG